MFGRNRQLLRLVVDGSSYGVQRCSISNDEVDFGEQT